MLVPNNLVRIKHNKQLALIDTIQAGCVRVEFADHSTMLLHPDHIERVRNAKDNGRFYSARMEHDRARRLRLARIAQAAMKLSIQRMLEHKRTLYVRHPGPVGYGGYNGNRDSNVVVRKLYSALPATLYRVCPQWFERDGVRAARPTRARSH